MHALMNPHFYYASKTCEGDIQDMSSLAGRVKNSKEKIIQGSLLKRWTSIAMAIQ
jgi:hypothetical protein